MMHIKSHYWGLMIKKSKWVHLLLQRMGGSSATPRRKDMKHQKNIVDLLSLNGSFKQAIMIIEEVWIMNFFVLHSLTLIKVSSSSHLRITVQHRAVGIGCKRQPFYKAASLIYRAPPYSKYICPWPRQLTH